MLVFQTPINYFNLRNEQIFPFDINLSSPRFDPSPVGYDKLQIIFLLTRIRQRLDIRHINKDEARFK